MEASGFGGSVRGARVGADRHIDATINPFTLEFSDRVLEADYRIAAAATTRNLTTVACILGALLFVAFGLLDTQVVAADDQKLIWIVRFAIICPTLFALAGFSRTQAFAKHRDFYTCATLVFASAGFDAMMVLADFRSDYASTGTLLILAYLFTFVRVRFTSALATAGVILVLYETASFFGAQIRGIDALYNNFFIASSLVVAGTAGYTLEQYVRRNYLHELALAAERTRSDSILLNVLPEEIAGRLKLDDSMIADAFEEASVLFADIVNFTALSTQLTPIELVTLLDEFFTLLDDLSFRHGLEKIKTIGDAYMAVAGLPTPRADHAAATADMALEMIELVKAFSGREAGLSIRIGISSGPVVAGVIGRQKFAYDLWGDTVNTASRMESHGTMGMIQVAQPAYDRLCADYEFGPPCQVAVKGKGVLQTYYLLSRKT